MKCTRNILLTAISFLVLLFPGISSAASLAVSWNANTESDLAGYKVYYGSQSKTYGTPVNVGKVTSYQLGNVAAGYTYYVALTAYNTSGQESGYSNEVSVYVPPAVTTPTLTLLTPANGAVVSANPLLSWKGTGFAKYRVLGTLNRTSYTVIYTGTGTSCYIPSTLWSLFIPSGTTVYWYVEGTTSGGQVYKSGLYNFRKQ